MVLAAWHESSSPRLKSSRFEICPKIAYLHTEWCEAFFFPKERWNSKGWRNNMQGWYGSSVFDLFFARP